jgi:hypothetical protein
MRYAVCDHASCITYAVTPVCDREQAGIGRETLQFVDIIVLIDMHVVILLDIRGRRTRGEWYRTGPSLDALDILPSSLLAGTGKERRKMTTGQGSFRGSRIPALGAAVPRPAEWVTRLHG